jgi:hydroxymethylpyrimidine pyrophosphatase-like HAD family hydrolase
LNPPDAHPEPRRLPHTTFALDYDGTIAQNGVLDETVRAAIGEAHSYGVRVLIVTGRILQDFRRVAGDLPGVDAVVAENGAILAVPPGGEPTVLAPPVPQTLVQALSRAAIPFQTGTCLVESDAAFAPPIRESIRDVGLSYDLIFNGTRVMALPIGVNKASGLREAVRTLEVPLETTLAIGDGENDHDLLEVADLGIAVSWGNDDLKAAADEVLYGTGPADVAAYIREIVGRARRNSRAGR